MIIKDTEKIAEELKHATTPEETVRVIENYFSEQWEKLDNDPEKVLDDVRETVKVFCDRSIATAVRLINAGSGAGDVAVVEDGHISFDIEKMTEIALGLVDDHRVFFNHERDDEIDQIVRDVVRENEKIKIPLLERTQSSRPRFYLSPTAKVSTKLFEGVFNDEQKRGVEVIKKAKSKKPIYTMVQINFSELENVKINSKRGLTPYDSEVYNAICTLYHEGGNIFITVNMIYQTMTGKENAHCSEKQTQTISDSITKLMLTHVIIDASDEATIDKRVTQARYDSTMINAKRVQIIINGQITEAIKILDIPIVFGYALQKNQIGRVDIKLLDTPNNKNEDTIILEGYLRRRILSIKGESHLSPTILYETVYKQIDLSGIKSDSALRNKKQKIRDTVKKALDYFKVEGFIKGYSETDKGDKNKLVGVTIHY